MTNRFCAVFAAMFALLAVTTPTRAATINFDVTASDFLSDPGFVAGLAPVDPLLLNATVTFNPAVANSWTTQGISLNAVNVGYNGQVGFAYDPTFYGSNDGVLFITNTDNTVDPVVSPDSFIVSIALAQDNPTATSLAAAEYYPLGNQPQFYATSGSVDASNVSATPLPAALPLFGSGLLILAGFATAKSRWDSSRKRRGCAYSTGKTTATLMALLISAVLVTTSVFAQGYGDDRTATSSAWTEQQNMEQQMRDKQNQMQQQNEMQQQEQSSWQPLGGTPLSPPPPSAPPPFGSTPLGGTDIR